jgi:hypothetical protein
VITAVVSFLNGASSPEALPGYCPVQSPNNIIGLQVDITVTGDLPPGGLTVQYQWNGVDTGPQTFTFLQDGKQHGVSRTIFPATAQSENYSVGWKASNNTGGSSNVINAFCRIIP